MERQELETVIYEKDGPIARIILNRPEKANSQSSEMVWDVEKCLTDAEQDYNIKVVIMKAEGRGFSAGHDVGGPGGDLVPRLSGFVVEGVVVDGGVVELGGGDPAEVAGRVAATASHDSPHSSGL